MDADAVGTGALAGLTATTAACAVVFPGVAGGATAACPYPVIFFRASGESATL